ncbi:MAG: oligosaccharide flippase family protein [Promethearchaeota archaeon]
MIKIKIFSFFNKFFSFHFKSNFIKNTSIIASGLLINQIVNIIFTPILSRIFSPNDFGILSVFTSILTILTTVSTFRFEIAIPLPKEDYIAFQLLFISIIVVSINTAVISIVLILFNNFFINLLSIEENFNFFYLIPIGLFFSCLYIIFDYFTIRLGDFKAISKSRLFQNTIGILFQVVLGLIGLRPFGLLVGSIIKRTSGLFILFKIVSPKYFYSNFRFNLKNLINTLIRYKKFPLISSISAFLNILGLNLPILLITKYYGTDSAGFYALSSMVVNIPLNTIGKAISQVFLKESSILYRENKTRLVKVYKLILNKLFFIGILPCLLLLVFGPKVFTLIFGKNWYVSGKIVQILSLMYLVQFISVPTSQLLTILERQEIQLIWDIIRLVIVFLSIYLPSLFNLKFIITVFFLGIGMVISYSILIFFQFIILSNVKDG